MRKYPCGAEYTEKGVSFRVWAPKCKKVELVIKNKTYLLDAEDNGYFSHYLKNIEAGTHYQFKLDNQDFLYPDPASRFQPFGPHGPSQIIDPKKFPWNDVAWRGLQNKQEAILYELHIGTFSPMGTWQSAAEKLSYLADLGVNVIEMMPVAECNGDFNWGYDGVNLFAPTHHYGEPDDLRTFINQAHELKIAVILDVVYNHLGPEGNYLGAFADDYLKQKEGEWGRTINFDGEGSQEVRAYFIANATYWISEFHFDGIRFDACHAIIDRSANHIISEITDHIRKAAGSKKTYIIAENEAQKIKFIKPFENNGYGLDAVFNEDFHHTAYVRLTGRREGYFQDYLGSAQEFVSSAKYGFLYQGQWYSWQKQKRGSYALDEASHSFINFIENHDQVANSGGGLRLRHFSQPGSYRAMVALFLLSPQTPLLFQGQEFGATTPFFYFSYMGENLVEKIFEGRVQFFSQFKSFQNAGVNFFLPPPHEKETFLRSKLKWEEKEDQPAIYNLYKDLIQLRKKDSVFSKMHTVQIDGAVFNEDAFVLRFRDAVDERLLLINFGTDLFLDPCPEPLLAPPEGFDWDTLWSSENSKYGAFGYIKIPDKGNWTLSGNSALVLFSKKLE